MLLESTVLHYNYFTNRIDLDDTVEITDIITVFHRKIKVHKVN